MSQNAIAGRARTTACNDSGNGQKTRRCLICERPARGRNRFCRAVGLGGRCPGCDEPILITDLLEGWR